MNILFFTNVLSPTIGGVQRVTYLLFKEFVRMGHSCYMSYFIDSTNDIDDKLKFKVDWSKDDSVLKEQMVAIVRDRHVDVFINQDLYSRSLFKAIEGIKEAGCIVVSCLHNKPDFFLETKSHWIKPRLAQWYSYLRYGCNTYVRDRRRMYDLCDAFVLLSDKYKEDFVKYYKIQDDSKLVSIPNPLGFLNTIVPSSKDNIILIVGRLSENQKNFHSALRIWKMVSEKYPDYSLVVAGTGQEEAQIKEYANHLDIQRCHFVGHVENTEELYKRGKLFMMTSRYEGFPMTIVEAMQFGCVPIVFDTFKAVHDMVRDGYDGFIVRPYDETAFAHVMITLLGDESYLREIASNSVRSSQRYSPDAVSKIWNDLLINML